MRKLKLQVQISVDGFIAGPSGELDFMEWNWDAALKSYVEVLTEPVDCIVLGRKLAEGFIPYWASVAADPDNPDVLDGKRFSETHKVVFTKTLAESPWENTALATSDLVDEITALKQQEGGDIIVYGGCGFVSSLLQNGLIDELHLFINPVAIGEGMSIFKGLVGNQKLVLESSNAFSCGIVVNQYRLGGSIA